jgi:phosphatidylserine/phosphatidylglycerophosphate/cardiolipin synthase-like enzyme
MPHLDVRLVRFDPTTRTDRPVPDGTRVVAMDADLLTADDVLGEARTEGGEARVEWADVTGLDLSPPDIYLRIEELSGATWDTRERFAEDGTPGLLPDARVLPAGLRTFRATLDLHLAFAVWDAENGWLPAPEGVPVEAVEADLLGADVVVAAGTTDADGRVDLCIDDPTEARPDLHLRLGPGAAALGLPAQWDSRDASPLGLPGRLGQWRDLAAARIGSPRHPLRFGLGPRVGRRFAGNRAAAIVDGVEMRAAYRDLIAAAEHTLHLEMMLLFDDPAGREVVGWLLQAADRGVKVRALVDVGTTGRIHQLVIAERFWVKHMRLMDDATRAETLARYAESAPAEEARGRVGALMARLAAHPQVSLHDTSFAILELDPDLGDEIPQAYRAIEAELPWLTTARVDHRKILLADGRAAIMGGQNVGQEYLYEQPFDPDKTAEEEPWHKWHDVSVRLEGPVVRDLQRLFRERWVSEGGDAFEVVPPGASQDPNHPTFPALSPAGDGAAVRILPTTPGAVHAFAEGFLAAVAAAERRVLVETPYLSSRDAVAALCAAARRGLEVLLILPDGHNDSVDFHYAARLLYPELLAAGVEVREYQHRMNHSKVAVIDDASWIGSANLNHSSFEGHYEVVAVVEDPAFTTGFVARLFDVDRPRSRRIRPDEVEALLDIRGVAKVYLEQVVLRLA